MMEQDATPISLKGGATQADLIERLECFDWDCPNAAGIAKEVVTEIARLNQELTSDEHFNEIAKELAASENKVVAQATTIEAQQAENARLREAAESGLSRLDWINAQVEDAMATAQGAATANGDGDGDGDGSLEMLNSITSDIGVNAMMLRDKLHAALSAQPAEQTLPSDVVRLVIAARTMALGDWFGEGEDYEVARKELDDASEAFASRVEWPDTPNEQDGGE